MLTDKRTIVILLLAGGALAAEKKPERTDLYGEPLPPGAIARLGRGAFPRLVAAGTFAFSPDGKSMATVAADDTLRLEKPPASLDLPRSFRESFCQSASVGGSLTECSISYHFESFVEKDQNWLLATTLHRKPQRYAENKEDKDEWLLSVAISPGGDWLAVPCPNGTLRIWAAAHPDILRQLQRRRFPTRAVVFSPDGKQAATASKDGTIRLWDIGSRKEMRRLQGPREAAVALAYSANGKVLVAAWQDGAIRIWNPVNGKEISQFQFEPKRCPVYAVAVSADDKWVTAGGRLGIQRWDATSRKERIYKNGSFERTHMIFALGFSSSNEYLVLADTGGNINTQGLAAKVLNATMQCSDRKIPSIAFSPDGATVATSGADGLRLWETLSGRERQRLVGNRWRSRGVAFSPDGGLLASGGNHSSVQLWEMPSGREKQPFVGLRNSIEKLGFLDKQRLLVGENHGVVRLWDATQVRELRSFGKGEDSGYTFAFSPGSKLLAALSRKNGTVSVWNAATEREKIHFQGNEGGISAAAFAPGGAVLATVGEKDHTVRLWEVATGRERKNFPASGHAHNAVAFSPDGKMLVFVGQREVIQLLEMATGRERIQFKGHQNYVGGSVNDFAFSADGQMLASAGSDGTALIWDVTGRSSDGRWQMQELTAAQLQSSWQTLAGDDAAAAHRAIWTLASAPRQTVPFLKEHLQPETPKDTKRLPTLLADLDSDQFEVREAATRELEALGEAAEPSLRKFLAEKPSLEARRRVEPMVDKLNCWAASSSTALRNWRALEVLEHLGTPEARQLLQKIAEGVATARLTREAKAALQRLAARQVPMP